MLHPQEDVTISALPVKVVRVVQYSLSSEEERDCGAQCDPPPLWTSGGIESCGRVRVLFPTAIQRIISLSSKSFIVFTLVTILFLE